MCVTLFDKLDGHVKREGAYVNRFIIRQNENSYDLACEYVLLVGISCTTILAYINKYVSIEDTYLYRYLDRYLHFFSLKFFSVDRAKVSFEGQMMRGQRREVRIGEEWREDWTRKGRRIVGG